MNPSVVVLAGPNGAGKTTASRVVLPKLAHISEFVNADVIAQGLSAFAPESVSLEAGRIMLARLRELADQRVDFAFETTLASRTFAPWLDRLIESGYQFQLLFFWVPSPEFSISRVASRVKMGGHHVDAETIRRRYTRGLRNLFELYQPIATQWFVYDNSLVSGEVLVAHGRSRITDEVNDDQLWTSLRARHDPASKAT